jgi:hypothetical protein
MYMFVQDFLQSGLKWTESKHENASCRSKWVLNDTAVILYLLTCHSRSGCVYPTVTLAPASQPACEALILFLDTRCLLLTYRLGCSNLVALYVVAVSAFRCAFQLPSSGYTHFNILTNWMLVWYFQFGIRPRYLISWGLYIALHSHCAQGFATGCTSFP